MINNISWRAIRAFILVADHGSFTAAANATGASKANLSQLVTELEKSLKVQLIHRTTRQLKLTEVGHGYYQQCKQAILDLDTASEWASQEKEKLTGLIKMNSVGGVLGEEIVAPLVLEFQQIYPDIQVALDFSSVQVDLIERQYDLVLRMGELPDSTLIGRRIANITTKYVASPSLVEHYPAIKQPEDLYRVPLIYGSVNKWHLKKGNAQRTINIDNGMKVISGRVMKKAAIAGLGVTRLADVYCQADIKSNKLEEVLPDWAETTPISIVCPPKRHQLKRISMLMDWLAERFNERYQKALNENLA